MCVGVWHVEQARPRAQCFFFNMASLFLLSMCCRMLWLLPTPSSALSRFHGRRHSFAIFSPTLLLHPMDGMPLPPRAPFVFSLSVFLSPPPSKAQGDTVAARNKQSEFTSTDYTFDDSREYRSGFAFAHIQPPCSVVFVSVNLV